MWLETRLPPKALQYHPAGSFYTAGHGVRGFGTRNRNLFWTFRALVELSGQVVVDLTTMLDESLELKGIIVTSSGTLNNSKKITLPVHLKVNKSFMKGLASP